MKRGDKLTVKRHEVNCWIELTEEERAAWRARDEAAGRFFDSAGESLLYGHHSFVQLPEEGVTVTVTSLRPKWIGGSQRPKHLFQVATEHGQTLLMAPGVRWAAR